MTTAGGTEAGVVVGVTVAGVVAGLDVTGAAVLGETVGWLGRVATGALPELRVSARPTMAATTRTTAEPVTTFR